MLVPAKLQARRKLDSNIQRLLNNTPGATRALRESRGGRQRRVTEWETSIRSSHMGTHVARSLTNAPTRGSIRGWFQGPPLRRHRSRSRTHSGVWTRTTLPSAQAGSLGVKSQPWRPSEGVCSATQTMSFTSAVSPGLCRPIRLSDDLQLAVLRKHALLILCKILCIVWVPRWP